MIIWLGKVARQTWRFHWNRRLGYCQSECQYQGCPLARPNLVQPPPPRRHKEGVSGCGTNVNSPLALVLISDSTFHCSTFFCIIFSFFLCLFCFYVLSFSEICCLSCKMITEMFLLVTVFVSTSLVYLKGLNTKNLWSRRKKGMKALKTGHKWAEQAARSGAIAWCGGCVLVQLGVPFFQCTITTTITTKCTQHKHQYIIQKVQVYQNIAKP